MNEELRGFLKDLFILIREKYDASSAEASGPAADADAAYRRGAAFAYYDVLDLMRSQVIAFGYDEEAVAFAVPVPGRPSHGDA
jgi:hypothetical protein